MVSFLRDTIFVCLKLEGDREQGWYNAGPALKSWFYSNTAMFPVHSGSCLCHGRISPPYYLYPLNVMSTIFNGADSSRKNPKQMSAQTSHTV